jgi:hypothetical protein
MKVFSDEADLKTTLDRFDELARSCALGKISFAKFDELYDSFYCAYALDGHESDAAEQELLARYEARIALHRDVWEEVLTRVCSDEDADQPAYVAAGRFGSAEAVARLKQIVGRHSPKV